MTPKGKKTNKKNSNSHELEASKWFSTTQWVMMGLRKCKGASMYLYVLYIE